MKSIMALLAWIFLAATPVYAQAPSRLDQITGRGVLRIGTTGDYRPFTFREAAGGGYSGFDIDLARALAESLGVKAEFVPTSWPNLMSDLLMDKFDIGMSGISVSLERQRQAYFSIPYMREGKTPIAKCADKDKFQALADIDKPGVKVITPPGGTNEKFDRANLKQAEIVTFADNTKIFDEIAAGRADVMITDASETRFQQKQHAGVLCAIHPDVPFNFAEKAYLLPRDEAWKNFVDQWLHGLIENGVYKKLSEQYLQ